VAAVPDDASSRAVVLGRVVGAHARGGEVRVRWLGDGPEHLLAVDRVRLGAADGAEDARSYAVLEAGAGRSGEVRLRLAGVEDRESAEALVGLHVLGGPAQLPALGEGEYYWFEWIGCRVEDAHGAPLGTVVEIWETGAHDVLVVEGADGRRRLLPAAAELLKEVDIEGRRIAIEVIPGLLDPV
jgi:16S rRNA processing protein RimM